MRRIVNKLKQLSYTFTGVFCIFHKNFIVLNISICKMEHKKSLWTDKLDFAHQFKVLLFKDKDNRLSKVKIWFQTFVKKFSSNEFAHVHLNWAFKNYQIIPSQATVMNRLRNSQFHRFFGQQLKVFCHSVNVETSHVQTDVVNVSIAWINFWVCWKSLLNVSKIFELVLGEELFGHFVWVATFAEGQKLVWVGLSQNICIGRIQMILELAAWKNWLYSRDKWMRPWEIILFNVFLVRRRFNKLVFTKSFPVVELNFKKTWVSHKPMGKDFAIYGE